jgi:hypothetical protein
MKLPFMSTLCSLRGSFSIFKVYSLTKNDLPGETKGELHGSKNKWSGTEEKLRGVEKI